MPKVSKVRSTSTKPKQAAPVKEERVRFYCSRCERYYTKQKGNFPAVQSPLYRGNGGYLTTCNRCVDELFEHYKATLGNEPAAIRRMCMKFDIYWHHDVYDMISKASTTLSRVRTYNTKTNLVKYVGKTFDDTLDEEYALEQKQAEEAKVVVESIDNIPVVGDIPVDPAVVEFWGAGFEPYFYHELDRKYKYWTGDITQELKNAEVAIYKQICILEATINRDSAVGKSIDRNVNALNTLLGSADIRPNQKRKDDASDVAFDNAPFGVGIRMYENIRPVNDVDPEFQDSDGIIRYISIWFLGHLCKMLGIKNTYCKLYEQEIEKLRVERPDIEEEDDEMFFDDIFGDDV